MPLYKSIVSSHQLVYALHIYNKTIKTKNSEQRVAK